MNRYLRLKLEFAKIQNKPIHNALKCALKKSIKEKKTESPKKKNGRIGVTLQGVEIKSIMVGKYSNGIAGYPLAIASDHAYYFHYRLWDYGFSWHSHSY